MKKVRQIVIVLAAVCVVLAAGAGAAYADVYDSGKCGTCTWEYDDQAKSLTISSGTMDDWEDTPPWWNYRSKIYHISIKGPVKLKTCNNMFCGMYSREKLDLSKLDTSEVKDMSFMFMEFTTDEDIDVSMLDTSNVRDFSYMFAYIYGGCQKLIGLDHFDTSKAETMVRMFERLSTSEIDVSNFDTSNVTDMESMFNCCSNVTSLDVSGFDTSNVENFSSMFYGCNSLKTLDVTSFDTSNAWSMANMFCGTGLKTIDLSSFDTHNVELMDDMFGGQALTSLDLSTFDTSNVTGMSYMFSGCSSLKKLDLSNFDTSKVKTMSSMFAGCSSLEEVDLSTFNTLNVDTFQRMFEECSSLQDLDLSSFDIKGTDGSRYIETMYDMFKNCRSLRSLKVGDWENFYVRWGMPVFPVDMHDTTDGAEYKAGDEIPKVNRHVFVAGEETPEDIDIVSEEGDEISNMTYLAMADLAYLSLDTNKKFDIVGKGVLGRDEAYRVGSNTSDSDITQWSGMVVNKIDPDLGLNWGHLYKQCLSTWEVIETRRDDDIGFFAIVLRRGDQVVLAYRGSDAIKWSTLGNDWLTDDAYAAFAKQISPQMRTAIDYAREVEKYCEKEGCELTFTGHSLGGGLAILANMATGKKAVPFDSAPTVEVGYYMMWYAANENFHGIDKWDCTDIMNEHCPVGNYEAVSASLIEPLLQTRKKNYLKVEDQYSGTLKYASHSRESMLTFNKDKKQFQLAGNVDYWQFGPDSTYCVTVRHIQTWNSLLQDTTLSKLIKQALVGIRLVYGDGRLRLGTSGDDKKVVTASGFLQYPDVIYGGDGNDNIAGFDGTDTLIGGPGNDMLDGGLGSDVYVYHYGHGKDTISDFSGNDTLLLQGFPSGTLVETVDTERYIEVIAGGETVVNISKNRSSNPINSFVIKTIDDDGEETGESVKVQDFNEWKNYRTFRIACPVSVQIIDSNGNVVSTVADGESTMSYTDYANMYCALNEETGEYEKYIDLKDGYDIRIVGEGEGKMEVLMTEAEDGEEIASYAVSDIPVTAESEFTVNSESKAIESGGESYDMQEVEPEEPEHMHSWSEWTVTKQPTVFEPGMMHRTCQTCGEEEYKSIPKIKPTIRISPKKKTIKKGKSFKIKVSNLAAGDSVRSFKSSKKAVATVNKKGLVKARKKGRIVITVKLKSGKTAKCTVTVK